MQTLWEWGTGRRQHSDMIGTHAQQEKKEKENSVYVHVHTSECEYVEVSKRTNEESTTKMDAPETPRGRTGLGKRAVGVRRARNKGGTAPHTLPHDPPNT